MKNKMYKLLAAIIPIMLCCVIDVAAQSLGLNNPTPDASSILDAVATDRGILIPRMTTAQRDNIPVACSCTPADGLQIINTTTGCLELYWGGVWNSLGCACVGAPAAPTATAATGLLATQFTANWIAASGATAYYLDVATDNLFTSMVTGFNNLNVSNVTGYNVTGLTCNTTYYYRVRASNNCGTGVNSATITAATAAASGPTAIAASGVQQAQFDANWGAVGGATTYYLDVATDATFISFVTGYNDLNVGLVTTATVTGLTCGTTYYYRVRAGTSCGASSSSNTISQATISSPAAPVATSGSGLLQTQFTANWGAVAGATTYYLDVATDAGFTTFVPGYSGISTGVVTSYNVSGLACNTPYYYRLRATSGCGTSGNSNSITVTTCACTPTSIAASNVLAGSFSANWASAGGATSYILDVATDVGFTAFVGVYSNLNVGLVTTYAVTGLSCNTTYYYRVRSGSTCAASGNSSTITTTTASTFATTATAASAIAQTQFQANWGSVASATSYILDVATDAGFVSMVAGYNGLDVGNVINYTVAPLSCNTAYYYRVRVVNSCGTSANSNTINPTTCVCTPTATAESGVTAYSFAANWTAVPSATTYYLDVATDIGFTSIVSGYNDLNVGLVTTYNVTGLTCNTAYYYRLRASSACGTSVSGNTINPTTLSTSAPTATAASAITQTTFSANWTAFSGATSYRLDVATDVGFGSMVAGFNDLNVGLVSTYSVTGLTCGTTYYYRVRVVNACGTSASSNTITTATSYACSWMASNWLYKLPITINNGGAALTNYEMLVTINTATLVTAGKMQSDGADIRVADADKCTQLNFWIETGTMNTATTNIWVKVPSVPAGSPSKIIYVYYGGGAVATASSGVNTFSFFDDFASGSLDAAKWTATGATSFAGSEMTITTGAVYSDATVASQTGFISEAKVKWTNPLNQQYSGLHIANAQSTQGSNSGSNKLVYLMTNAGSAAVQSWAANGTAASYNINGGTTQFTATSGTSYIIGHAVSGANVIFYNNRAVTNSYAGTWSGAFYLWLGYFTGNTSGTQNITDIAVDWVLVRQLAATIPTTVNGAEEAACL